MCSKNWLFKLLLAAAVLFNLSNAVAAEKLTTELSKDFGGNFTLQSAQGPISLEQLHGRLLLVFFGFTSCPDICPTALAVISRVFNQLDAQELARVQALFVSLDPQRDNLELLQKYTGYFHTNIVGVTDRIEVINEVTQRYGISFERKEMESSPIGYVIHHSPDILIVNREGQLLHSRITPWHDVDEILTFVRAQIHE